MRRCRAQLLAQPVPKTRQPQAEHSQPWQMKWRIHRRRQASRHAGKLSAPVCMVWVVLQQLACHHACTRTTAGAMHTAGAGQSSGFDITCTCTLQGGSGVLSIFRPLSANTAALHVGVPTGDPTADGTQTSSQDAQPAAVTQDHTSSRAGTCKASRCVEEFAGGC
jgi:hypothetical protein